MTSYQYKIHLKDSQKDFLEKFLTKKIDDCKSHFPDEEPLEYQRLLNKLTGAEFDFFTISERESFLLYEILLEPIVKKITFPYGLELSVGDHLDFYDRLSMSSQNSTLLSTNNF
ncbi:hypothetical protein DPM18_08140 [Polynucleobacter paneuropaeus]|jgi:hypothetical protein|uniref:hypothetical protein n=1 Tax=Polynucleobacter paneuropaeus TaxID=2527775 RepID=UPI000DBF33A7|nr:hypothetical protein [Polynucleobacter paneuropaeus]AWW46781.1 hypothetical protein DPM18_08140 [Polynucleobacter paneuropaeus]